MSVTLVVAVTLDSDEKKIFVLSLGCKHDSTEVLISANSVRRVGGKRKPLITIVDNTWKIINESLMSKLLRRT